jgi:hypothetical protein
MWVYERIQEPGILSDQIRLDWFRWAKIRLDWLGCGCKSGFCVYSETPH